MSAKERNIDFDVVKDDDINLTNALVRIFANVGITEMRMYNGGTKSSRPTFKEAMYMYAIMSITDCTASDLVDLFGVSKALVSQSIIAMEEKGFIERVRDTKDKRRQIIKVSDQAEEYMKERDALEYAERMLLQKYTPEQIGLACRIFIDLTDEGRKHAFSEYLGESR